MEIRSEQPIIEQHVEQQSVPSVREGFSAFWRFYLKQHAHPKNRFCHILGTSLALISIIASILISHLFWLVAVLSGYGFAWYGHYVYEKNKPATFKAPLRSLLCDFVMVYDSLRQWVRSHL